MSRGSTAQQLRCLLVAAGTTGAAALLEAWLVPHLLRTARGGGPAGFEELLVTGSGVAAAGCVGWLWLLVTLVVGEALRGHSTGTGARVPPAVRRVVLAACGLSLAGGLLAPAHAADRDPVATSPAQVLVGLPVPDRMTTAQWLGAVAHEARRVPVATPRARREAGTPDTTVVSPGDSLWSIARRTLPAGADAVAVDRRWRRIYHANRGVIGPDPDLLLPGQRLHLPTHRPSR